MAANGEYFPGFERSAEAASSRCEIPIDLLRKTRADSPQFPVRALSNTEAQKESRSSDLFPRRLPLTHAQNVPKFVHRRYLFLHDLLVQPGFRHP